jgi:hypothetical protein
MTVNSSAATCIVAAAFLTAHAPSSSAQKAPDGLKNPQVEIKYEDTQNAALVPIRDRLQQRYVLEKLQIFLSPLTLPEKLFITAKECGALNILYKTGSQLTLCYEYVAKVEADAPRVGQTVHLGGAELTREEALVGPVTQVVLHDVARALFHIYKVPVWGNAEFAADHVAAFTMVNFSDRVAWKTVVGSAWYLKNAWDSPVDIVDIRPHVAQRYFALLCIAFASDPGTFSVFVASGDRPKSYELPERRSVKCQYEYPKLDSAFRKAIFDPHVDKAKYEALKKLEWLTDF